MIYKPYLKLAALLVTIVLLQHNSAWGQGLYGLAADADTWLSNGAGEGPTNTHGGQERLQVRWYDDGAGVTRIRLGYVRFDISGINPDFFSTATISGTFERSNRDGPGTWQVWGLNDTITATGTQGADWDEAATNYANAAGLVNTAPIGTFEFSSDATQLGTLAIDTMDMQPLPFMSNSTDLNLGSFLASDTDGLVTFILMDSEITGTEFYIDSKENNNADGHGPMKINFLFPDGDVDGYNGVDLDDLQIIADNFRQSADSRLTGDLTGDGFVDFDDFDQWKQNYTGSLAGLNLDFLTTQVPEPGSLLLAALGVTGVLAWRLCRGA